MGGPCLACGTTLSDAAKANRLCAMAQTDRYTRYADEIDQLALECGAHGYSRTQIAACIGISRHTIADWVKKHPRFADILDRADTLAQAWWEGRAQDGTANQRIGPSIWHKSVAARFPHDYADRTEVGAIGDGARVQRITWKVKRVGDVEEAEIVE
jgi:hypothetical protein